MDKTFYVTHNIILNSATTALFSCLPILDYPVIDSISAVPYSQYPMVQFIGTTALIIVHTTRIELKLVA